MKTKKKTKARIKARLAQKPKAPVVEPDPPKESPAPAPEPLDLLNVLNPVPWDTTKEYLPAIARDFVASAPPLPQFEDAYEFEHEFMAKVGEVAELFKRNGADETEMAVLGDCASFLARMIRNATIWCDAVIQFGEFIAPTDASNVEKLCRIVASGKQRPHARIAAWAALCHRYGYNPADILVAKTGK
jgi:hypothetical protein